MPEPRIKKFPTEIFGYPYSDVSQKAQRVRNQQHCPFLDSECKKPRKSEPETKIGVCSVGYRGGFMDDYIPVIICPHRFDLDVVFNVIEEYYLPNIEDGESLIEWASEVSLGKTTGSVDFVGAKTTESKGDVLDKDVIDFVCVEIQAGGTTGTPWEAVLEHKATGKFSKDTYKYGINWANEFAKTMMQQAYKKGRVIEGWNKKIVFAIQDVALQYLEDSYDTSTLREANDDDAIHFCTFKLVWEDAENRWKMIFRRRLSTDTDGVRRILGGVGADDFPLEERFVENIVKRIHKHN